jgi:SAM-dependent methyltransferase
VNPGPAEVASGPRSRPADERCPACATSRFEPLFSARGFAIGRCRDCGLTRTLGVPGDLLGDYPPFDQRETGVVRLFRSLATLLVRERLAFVQKVQPAGRLLDFGCGSGSFARLASAAGYDVVGVEPFSLGRGLESPGLRLVRGSLDECGQTLGQFDVITLWQVLEHVPDPGALLARLVPHLQPAGTLVVSVPNFASWQSRFFGPEWFHLDPPRHITHFEPATMSALFDRLDLEVVSRQTFHLEYGPIGWLQSALNRVLPRKNFFHEFVKDRGALADLTVARTMAYLAGSLLGSAALALPALAVEAAAARAGSGAVLTFALRTRARART